MSNDISKLIQLEHNLKNCENELELFYSIVNQTREIVAYDQAVLLGLDLSSKLKVESVSDIVTVDSTSPFIQYMQNIIFALHHLSNISKYNVNYFYINTFHH